MISKLKNNVSKKTSLVLLPFILAAHFHLWADDYTVEDEDVYELSPFEVDGSGDVGYMAASSLAGSRLNTSLKDIPASLQVYTKEFLDDIGAVNLEDALQYSANVELDTNEESFFTGSFLERSRPSYAARVRGLPSSRTRDFFRWGLPTDSYVTERLDEARGPNALLFGIASAGGVTNQSTKKAMLGRDFQSMVFRTDSNDLVRGELDINRVLIDDRLAIRINMLDSDEKSWRTGGFSDKTGFHVTVLAKLTDSTSVKVSYETFHQDDIVAGRFLEADRVSDWLNAGRPTYDIFSENRASWAKADGSISGKDRDIIIRPNGVTTKGSQPYITFIQGGDASFDGEVVSLTRHLYTENYIDPDGDGRYNRRDDGIRDDSVVPYDMTFLGGIANLRELDYTDFVISLDQRLTDNAYLQVDYQKNSYNWWSIQGAVGGGSQLRGDPNEFFAGADRDPSSAIKNPNAGGLYLEIPRVRERINPNDNETFRVTGSFQYDFAEKNDGWLSLLGNHRVAVGYEKYEMSLGGRVTSEIWMDAETHAPAYDTKRLDSTSNFAGRRVYVDLNQSGPLGRITLNGIGELIDDPVNPGRKIYSKFVNDFISPDDIEQEIEGMMLSTQSRFFNDRLVLTAGLRWDEGSNKKYLYHLNDLRNEYVRIGNDTYNFTSWDRNNKTVGAVYHFTDRISVFYNQATNNNVPEADSVIVGSLDNPGEISYPGAGKGNDFGIRMSLLDNRVNVRLTRYETSEDNALKGNQAAKYIDGTHDKIIEWWSDLGFGLADDPASARLFNDRVNRYALSKEVEGYEVQVTANFTKSWRAIMNYSYTDKNQMNVGIVENQWFEQTQQWAYDTIQNWDTSTVTQEWLDSGIIATNNVDEFTLENGTIISDWFEQVNSYRGSDLVPGAPFGLRKHKFNFFTNYSFKDGILDGFSAGLGYRFQSGAAMHWEVDSDGNRKRFWSDDTSYFDAMFKYVTNLDVFGDSIRTTFQLNIRNLLDDTDIVPGRYWKNDSSNPFDRAYYTEPRKFSFMVKFDF